MGGGDTGTSGSSRRKTFPDLHPWTVFVFPVAEDSASNSASFFRRWGEGLVHDPLPIGGIAVAVMLGTGALLDVSVSGPLLVAAFCGVALIYGTDRALVAAPEDEWNRPRRARWVRAHRGWLYGEAGALLVVGMAALSVLPLKALIWGVGLAALGGLHLLSGGTGRPFDGLGIGKPLLVAGAWALGGAILPLVGAGVPLGATAWGLAGYRFFCILPNVLLSDWGDRAGDRAAGGASWTRWGTERGLRGTATGLLVLALILAGGMAVETHRVLLFGVDAVGVLLMGGAVWTLRPECGTHRFLLDVLVAWPVVTALVAWGSKAIAC